MIKVLGNIGTLVQAKAEGLQRDLFEIENAALVFEGEKILWLGVESDLPTQYESAERIDAEGALVIPGLIDCHTHLAFGGWRAEEFSMRIEGRPYLEIAEAGGGIASSMEKTRSATKEELVEKSLGLLQEIGRLGVTTVECKSGYGLSAEAERKQLEVYRELKSLQELEIVSTFLGAHIVPPEYAAKRETYIDLLCNDLIPAFAKEGLAEFCDVFVEKTAYSIDEARMVLEAGQKHGLGAKLHVDQLSAF